MNGRLLNLVKVKRIFRFSSLKNIVEDSNEYQKARTRNSDFSLKFSKRKSLNKRLTPSKNEIIEGLTED